MTAITVAKLGALLFASVLIGPPSPTISAESVERVATLRTGRAAHTATTLRSGHVLIAGGMATDGGSLATVELFDPSTSREWVTPRHCSVMGAC